MSGEPAKKSKTMLYASIGGGVLLLGCCCLGLAGSLVWFFFLSGPGDVDKVMIGKWQPELELSGGVKGTTQGLDREFKADFSYSDNSGNFTGTWKKLDKKDNTATIEVTVKELGGERKRTMEIKPVTNNLLEIKEKDKTFKYKRI